MGEHLFTDLSLSAQTNFAELVDRTLALQMARSFSSVPGSFNKKAVKGIPYWYWQWKDLDGHARQAYLGPDDERVRRLIAQREHNRSSDAAAADQAGRLAAACVQLGCMNLTRQHFRVIKRLSEHGLFRAGGVLIGTHAFLAMSNMLGVRWGSGWNTNDIDFAHPGKNVSLALPSNLKVDVHDAIESLEMGLLPARSPASPKGATYLTKSGDLRVDLLTTVGRSAEVFHYEPLNVYLEPLKFMEFSLEKTTQTAILGDEDSVIVNIPAPMRYAMHKLLVMAERNEQFHSKLPKDAMQVAALVSYGLERNPLALRDAADDMMARGKGWTSRLTVGLAKLAVFHADVAQRLADFLGLSGPASKNKAPAAKNPPKQRKTARQARP